MSLFTLALRALRSNLRQNAASTVVVFVVAAALTLSYAVFADLAGGQASAAGGAGGTVGGENVGAAGDAGAFSAAADTLDAVGRGFFARAALPFAALFIALAGVSLSGTRILEVYRRRTEFALLAGLGFSPRQLFTLVMIESGLVAGAASLLGASAAGLVANSILTGTINPTILGVDLNLQVDFSLTGIEIALAALVIAALVLVFALAPAIVVTRFKYETLLREG